MPQIEMVKIQILKGCVCNGQKIHINPKGKSDAEKYPVVDAPKPDARYLILTGMARAVDGGAKKAAAETAEK